MTAKAGLRAEWQKLAAPLRARWNALNRRAQRIVAVGAALLLLAILWAYVWLPAVRGREQIAAQLPVMETKLARMRAQAAEVQRIVSLPPVAGKAGARTLADVAGLQAVFGADAKVAMIANNRFRISIPGTAYGAWLDRLDQAMTRYRVRIDSLALNATGRKTGEAADVQIELVLMDENAARTALPRPESQ